METEELRTKLLEEIDKMPEEQVAGLKEKIESMNESELHEFIKQSSTTGCLFCQIVAGKIETVKIYESANILAVLDVNPANPGHLLVLPKQHYQFITQIPEELLYELFSFVKYISPVLLEIVKAQGIDTYVPQGISQTVPHLVINIIPRFKDDSVNTAWQRKKVPRSELDNIAAKIRTVAKQTIPVVKQEDKETTQKKGEKKEKTEEEKEIEAMLKFYTPKEERTN